MVRLERGGAEFLTAVTTRLFEMGQDRVYSPALYPDATRVWRRAGYDTHATLGVMERTLSDRRSGLQEGEVTIEVDPNWDEIYELDREAFAGFWRMSKLGLIEANDTNRRTALLTTRSEGMISGYAIVGTQWGVTYLHRIAVHPEHGGRGFGAGLMDAAIDWGRRSGGRTMVLNVRHDNGRARRVYERSGFVDTGTALEVLSHPRE